MKTICILLCMLCIQFVTLNAQTTGMPYVLDMVHNNPGEEPYVTKYNSPSFLKQQGFTGAVTHWHVNCAVTYDSFEKGLIPIKSEERIWIENHANRIKEKLADFEKYGINVYPFTDFLVFPKTIWLKYGHQLRGTNTDGGTKPDIQSSLTQRLLRIQIDEIFTRFPDLDGITLRFGETYLHDTPFHQGNSPIRSGDRAIEDHVLLLNILREEVCVKRNKKLFYRTWDFGYNFHNNPDFYLAVTNQVAPHPNLIFSIKYQQGDYHRMTPFNPSLGIGKHAQIVESQSRMEAYGKGAHPYYTAKGVIEGWPETKYEITFSDQRFTGKLNDVTNPRGIKDVLSSGLIQGVMTWSHGGGWQGPYIKHEIWTDLNTYVMSHWAQNPSLTEETLFNQFADSLGFDAFNKDLFRQIAMLSIEGVRKGHCCSYAANSVWWTRDEFFSVSYNRNIIKDIISRNVVDKVLAEKQESVAIWNQIEAISKQLQVDDETLLEAIRVSSTYGRIKYQIIELLWIMMIEDEYIRQGKSADRVFIAKLLKRYDELWQEWRTLEKENRYCATIYTELAFRNKEEGSGKELVERLRSFMN